MGIYRFYLTGLLNTPIPSTSTSTTSSTANGLTPAGVPVIITSPGINVITAAAYEMIYAGENTISLKLTGGRNNTPGSNDFALLAVEE